MLKELFLGSTDFTVAIFKIPQISKHFLAMLILTVIQGFARNESCFRLSLISEHF